MSVEVSYSPHELRVLTIRQPHASAIIFGGKNVENRTRPTPYRGLLAIHAGMKFDPDATAPWEGLPRGVIIGVAELVGCHESMTVGGTLVCCGWGVSGYWHWELRNRRRIAEPVACRGHLPIFHAPDDVAAAVLAQL